MGVMPMLNGIKKIFNKEGARRKFCSAIVPAAGSSTRMAGENKLLCDLNGMPVIIRTLMALDECELIDEIIVVTKADQLENIAAMCTKYDIKKVVKVVNGGATRQASVLYGLCEIDKKSELVAVHDGARPLVSQDIIKQAVMTAAKTGAAAPSIQIKDTVKIVSDGVVKMTPEREKLVAVQTPQVFDSSILKGALYKAEQDGTKLTDDCSAVEAIGYPVVLTEGDETNIKITTPTDLLFARTIVAER
jgi:2-C-methyl-D-erythritol 4-phosphate cytidylyltransferase